MALGILLVFSGTDLIGGLIGFVVATILGFLLWRWLLQLAIRKNSASSTNLIAVFGGLTFAPVVLGLVTAAVLLYFQRSKSDLADSIQTVDLPPTQPTLSTAHPDAARVLTSDFYWKEDDATAFPFGSYDWVDSYYLFVVWREKHKEDSVSTYLEESRGEWGLSSFDMRVIDHAGIADLVKSNTRQQVILTDNFIISTGFAQVVLEGRIDADVQELTRSAILRELDPEMLRQVMIDDEPRRIEQLRQMLADLEKF